MIGQEQAICLSDYFGDHCICWDDGEPCCRCDPGPEAYGELMQGEPPEDWTG